MPAPLPICPRCLGQGTTPSQTRDPADSVDERCDLCGGVGETRSATAEQYLLVLPFDERNERRRLMEFVRQTVGLNGNQTLVR